MNLITLVLFLIVVGVLLYVIETIIPMDYRIKRVIEVVVLLAVLIYILQGLGILSGNHVNLR